jgi:cysteine desulfurase
MAAAAVEVAREQVAGLLPPGGRVVFTGSATEALNLAIFGSGAGSFAVSPIEHAAVLDTVRAQGGPCQVLPCGSAGVVPGDAPIPAGTGLVAVMQVNNEIGTVQPVETLARAARDRAELAVVVSEDVDQRLRALLHERVARAGPGGRDVHG